MPLEFIYQENCIPPTHLYSNNSIVLKYFKLIKNILEYVCLVFFSFYFENCFFSNYFLKLLVLDF